MKKTFLILACFLWANFSFGQLIVDNTITPQQAVQNILLGPGVSASNITFSGDNNQVGSFDATAVNIGINYGVILATGDVNNAIGPNNSGSSSMGGGNLGSNDPDLDAISGVATHDAAILEFDFIPAGDSLKFNYVFSSEEYIEFVNSTVNDAFGFFLSGPGITGPYTSPAAFPNGSINIALIPGTTTPVSINTVNQLSNSAYFYHNENPVTIDIQYDGLTVVLTAKAAVQCGQTYHIKLAIADGGDTAWDSGVFLQANSFSSNAVQINVATVTGDSTIIEGCGDAIFSFFRPDPTLGDTVHFDISGNAINGTDYNFVADSIVFAAGQDSAELIISPIADGIAEAGDTIVITAITINPCGDTIVSQGTVIILDAPDIQIAHNDTLLTCPVDSLMIGVSASGGVGGYTYNWSNGMSGDTIYIQNPQAYQVLYVDVFDTCNIITVTDSVIIDVNFNPMIIQAAPDTTVSCAGDIANLYVTVTGGGMPYTYSWSTGSNSANAAAIINQDQWFYITVQDNCGTYSEIDSMFVDLNTPPIISSTNGPITLDCPGDSAELIVTVSSGTAPFTYSWSTGSTNDTTYINPSVSGMYYVDITDDCNVLPVQDSIEVIVNDIPVTVTAQDETVVCPGDQAILNAVPGGGTSPFSYVWSSGGNTASESVNPITTTTYEVIITDGCGKMDTTEAIVTVPTYNPVLIDLVENDTLCLGSSGAYQTIASEGAGQFSYYWVSSTDSIAGNPVSIAATQTDIITVYAIDQCGNVNNTDFEIYVEVCDLVIPNIITPDGDGQNDAFEVLNIEKVDHNLQIFGRWGNLLFETDNYQNDWNGDGYSSGTYMYVITVPEQDKVYNGYFVVTKGN